MAAIQLTDLVLLRSAFEMWPPRPEGTESTSESDEAAFSYPEGDFLQLGSSSDRGVDDNEIVLWVEATLDDVALPFRLDVLIGARYHVAEPEERLPAERVEPTLVWMCYPYIRELVAAITGRSPMPPYYLPALTRLPDPSVLETSEAGDEPPTETPSA